MDVLSNTDAQLHCIYYKCCFMHINFQFIMVLEHLDMENTLYMV